jgi:hypothetical protein
MGPMVPMLPMPADACRTDATDDTDEEAIWGHRFLICGRFPQMFIKKYRKNVTFFKWTGFIF